MLVFDGCRGVVLVVSCRYTGTVVDRVEVSAGHDNGLQHPPTVSRRCPVSSLSVVISRAGVSRVQSSEFILELVTQLQQTDSKLALYKPRLQAKAVQPRP